MLTDCFGDDAIAEVIDLGRKFITNIDDAISILSLSNHILARRAQARLYPIDRHVAFAIKSGLLEMCFEFLARFTCNPTVQLLARDPKRDDLIGCLVGIADNIKSVAFHQKTSKAIRDRRSHIVEALVKSKQSTEFVDIVSSIIELNEGSCSHCNKPIEWRTALFCGGCRRVAYCGKKCQKKDWRHGTHSSDCSILAHSANVLGLTSFAVRRSRNIAMLSGLRNNMVTSQRKMFLRHEDALSRQLSTYPDRSDYIAVFDLSDKLRSISFVHYDVVFTCPKQRKWFEDFRSPVKVVCMFTSDVFNGELDEEGNVNRIALYAAFPFPTRIQSSFTLYATATMSEIKSMYPETKSSEHYPNVINMFETLTKEDRAYWDKQAALELADSSSDIPSHTRAEALKGMGNDFFKIGDYKSAVEMYTFATTISSSAPTYWSNLAASYEKLGMYDKMQEASESCIYADQTFIKGYFRLATALKAKQKMAECIVTLDRGLDIDPTNADLNKMRKEVWEML
jgi:tetratricopeptide (TPR) repeat protein